MLVKLLLQMQKKANDKEATASTYITMVNISHISAASTYITMVKSNEVFSIEILNQHCELDATALKSASMLCQHAKI